MEKVIISGATGYIGLHLCKALDSKYEVYAIVRKQSNLKELKKYVSSKRIIMLEDNIKKFYTQMKEIEPDYFVHLAGKFISEHSEANLSDLLDSNLTAPVKMLDAICKAGCKNIINTGSYWQNYDGDNYNPVDLYAATKMAFSNMLKYYTEVMGCKSITLKLFDTYGKDDERKKVLNIIRDMRDGETLDMTSCEQKVFYCYIDDVISAYMHALKLIKTSKSHEHKEYSIRSEIPIPLKDIVLQLKNLSGKNIQLNFGKRDNRNREIMNPEGIGEVLPGWQEKYSIETGLKIFLNIK